MEVAAHRPVRLVITLPSRRVVVAVCASLVVHAGVVIAMRSFTVDASERTVNGAQFASVASDLALAMQSMTPPAALPPEERAATTPPPHTPAPPPPPPLATKPDEPRMVAMPAPLGERERLEIEVTPGIDDSKADTPNWLGAAEGTEHHAMKSTTDQPAMSRDPGRRGADEAHEGQPAAPTESDVGEGGKGDGQGSGTGNDAGPSREEAVRGQEATREAQGAQEGREGRQDGVEGGTGTGAKTTEEVAAEHGAGAIEVTQPRPEDVTGLMPEQRVVEPVVEVPTVDAQPEEATAGTAADARAAQEAAVLGSPVSAGGGQAPAVQPGSESKVPGKKSDLESPASSREVSLKFRPGMPLAHEGIRIRPKLPRYTMTTRALSRPNNPLVVIKFNRAGKVVKAEFAAGRTTGSPDWDGPLLASLYEWTATGKKLQDLPTSDPDAVLVLRLEYLLHE
ncbi:MAG TPA: hypothetical protein VHN77_15695 [Phycisphaerales bacterium]|nr:hypothetical protein [Phycisphaerales bacterium]